MQARRVNLGGSSTGWNLREIHIEEPLVMQIPDKELHLGRLDPPWHDTDTAFIFISSQPAL